MENLLFIGLDFNDFGIYASAIYGSRSLYALRVYIALRT